MVEANINPNASTQTLPVQNGVRKLSTVVAIISTSVLLISTLAGAGVYIRSVMVERSDRVNKVLDKHDIRIRKVEEGQIRQETLMGGMDTRQQQIDKKIDKLLDRRNPK